MNYKIQKRILIFGFLFIPIVLNLMFLVYPFIKMFIMSFTDSNGISQTYKFVKFDNYETVFSDAHLWMSLKNNLYYFANGLIQNVLGLLFAYILSTKLRGRNLFKAIIFVPYILSSTAVAYTFNYIYDYGKGPLNVALIQFGLHPIRFLSSLSIVNVSLAFICLWRYVGFTMVLYIAALQSVPSEIYEAGVVDGANSWQAFRYITLPNIKRIVELNLFLTLAGSFNAFTEALILTGGGPGYASSTFLTYTIDAFFKYGRYGFSCALSVILMALIVLTTSIQRRLILGKGDDENSGLLR